MSSFGERLAAFVRRARRQLIILGASLGLLLGILPFSSETNPAYADAQRFLDDMVLATIAVQDGVEPPELEVAGDRVSWAGGEVSDGSLGSVVVGTYEERCFVVHWTGAREPRAVVLDPQLDCDASTALATLPSPPFIESFPGTVPPLDASQIVKPAESRARPKRVEPFPKERTPAWFVPAVTALLAVALWQSVGLLFVFWRQDD